jgi:hypothetical protein
MKLFKLIVQYTNNCVSLLRYINLHIGEINNLGAVIKIEKVNKCDLDEDLVDALRKRGITRLPAMLGPDGSPFIGASQIIKILNAGLTSQRNTARIAPPPAINDLAAFYEREMFDHDKSGIRVNPRQDPEDEYTEGGQIDFTRKMSDFTQQRGPLKTEQDIDYAPRQSVLRRNDTPRQYSAPQDNIADDDGNVNSYIKNMDSTDAKMFEALMNNIDK